MNGRPDARLIWIDVAKTVGIFLVVFSHFDQSGFTESFLWTFHVPLFFFISGYLVRPRSDREFLGGTTRRLVVPYVCIYAVIVLLTAVAHSDYDVHSILRALAGVLYGTHSYPWFANDAMWFLPSLITVEALYTFCVRRCAPSYLLFLAVSYALYRQHYLDLFFSIDLSLLGLNFFLAGVLAKRFDVLRAVAARRSRLLATAALGAACTAAAASVGNLWYAGEHYALSLGAGLAGILMVVSASMLVAPLLGTHRYARAFFTFISMNTLFIFCFHVFSNPAAAALLAPVGLGPPLTRAAATAVVSIALLVPFNLLVRRFVPELIGLRRVGAAAAASREA
jgi:acyltransferase